MAVAFRQTGPVVLQLESSRADVDMTQLPFRPTWKLKSNLPPRIRAGIDPKPPIPLEHDNPDHPQGPPRGEGAKKQIQNRSKRSQDDVEFSIDSRYESGERR